MDSGNYSIKDRVLFYQRTGIGLEEIIMTLSRRIYYFPRGRYGSTEDDCGEFFIFFYPRLIRVVKNFKDMGKPFEWYFNSILCWQFKSYIKKRRQTQAVWDMSCKRDFWEPSMQTDMPSWPDPKIAEILGINSSGKINNPACGKRFLFWVLKYVRYIDDSAINRISELTGYKRNWLDKVIKKLEMKISPQEERLKTLKIRQNKAFFKLKILEGEEVREVDRKKIEQNRARLNRLKHTIRIARDKIARIPLSPSNREIGEVLNISKGTVDSSLHWLKKRLSLLYS